MALNVILVRTIVGERHKNMRKYILVASVLAVFCLVAAHYTKIHAEAQHSEYLSDLRIAQFAAIAMTNYAIHHKGRLPNSHNWEESIAPYWSDQPYSVSFKEHTGDRLAMNNKLSGVKLADIALPDSTIVFYETHSTTKDTHGAPPWEQFHQCNRSEKGWLMMVFASGWACSCAKGSEISFTPKK